MAQPKESTFVLLSLKDREAKKLGQVISSETARKILDALAQKKYTETDLAEALQIPLSTVHYNLRALVETKLVTADEYHYSEKGREVIHYGLANKYVIIAPASAQEGVLSKLKSLLPVAVLVAAVGWAIQWFGAATKGIPTAVPTPMLEQAMEKAVPTMAQAAPEAARMAADAAPAMKSAALQAAPAIQQGMGGVGEPTTGLPIGLWFAIGAAFALTLYLLIEALRKRWK